jgi:membrane dipeptidase
MDRITILLLTIALFFLHSCKTGDEGDELPYVEDEMTHQKILTLDTHVDTPWSWFFKEGFNFAGNDEGLGFNNQVDLDKMKRGGLDAIFLVAYVDQGPLDDEGFAHAIDTTKKLVNHLLGVVADCHDMARLGTYYQDAYDNEKDSLATIYLAIENGHAIGDSLPMLQEYYDKGVRYITLCVLWDNAICDSSTDPDNPVDNGLSDFGRLVVQEMNRLGIMIDISHVSDKSFFDVLSVTNTPVIASHSAVRSLRDHPRNLSDDMLMALAMNGGVLQVCFVGPYLSSTFPTTVSVLVDHIDYAVNLIGIDHVGIGSDFDGGGGLLDCRDASQVENITNELINRGYNWNEIQKIWGGNLLRVFREVALYAENKTVGQ